MDFIEDDNKNDDGPENTLDRFDANDKTRVVEMINELPALTSQQFEDKYEEYSEILAKYQEQPHLLDCSLEELTNICLTYLTDSESTQEVKHHAAKYLYQICKVRTFKAFIKYLPHEVKYLNFVLKYLEEQDLEDWQNWETRYISLLWLSILILNPFDLSRLDGMIEQTGGKNTMQRIYDICKINCLKDDSCTVISAFLLAKFIVRNDVKKVFLNDYFEWTISTNFIDDVVYEAKIGTLMGIAYILKHGKREDLIELAGKLAKWILHLNYDKISKNFNTHKTCIKIIQKIGLVLLPPRIAKWRYQRGQRSLLANLTKTVAEQQNVEMPQQEKSDGYQMEEQEDDESEDDIPEEIEEIVERLLSGLKGNSTIVRWSSAKGIGRITNRLSKALGDEVVTSVIEMINPLEQDDAWHGACLALAELAKRGLLLPDRLGEIVPLQLQALVYDEIQGYRNVGQNIRDAACYMSWAFARAYHPQILQPFVEKIASALLVTAVFDREINCRRAASAAFQESVGRLGNFPHGIDILTVCDFFNVAMRNNSFLFISDFIAQYEEYKFTLIDHLVGKKINHWDTNIRELSALALSKLSLRAPEFMRDEILDRLFALTDTTDLNARHGSVIAIGEIILSLTNLQNSSNIKYINTSIVDKANSLVQNFRQRGQFKGMSGTFMKHGCASFIKNCSEAKLETSNECRESWLLILNESLIDEKVTTRELSVAALSKYYETYYHDVLPDTLLTIIASYIKTLKEATNNEHKSQGIVLMLGQLPDFMLKIALKDILTIISDKTVIPESFSVGYNHSELRRDCIKSLVNISKTIGFIDDVEESLSNADYLNLVFDCYKRALDEYAIDNRGDIGSWVREAGISALYHFLTTCPHKYLTAVHVNAAMVGIAKQAVERIDKIRAIAGKMFVALIYHEPQIPYIEHIDRLKEIFPEDCSSILWLFPHHTFPLFIQLLNVENYTENIARGLIMSVGAPTESLHICAAKIMNDYLKHHTFLIKDLGINILKICQQKSARDVLFMASVYQFLAEFLGTSSNNEILYNDNNEFIEKMFQYVNDLTTQSKKYFNSIPVYCALMLAPAVCKRVMSKLVMFLGMICVNVRRETALRMYETLLVYGDQTKIPEENLDEILMLLSEEKWDEDIDVVRTKRNNLCTLLDVKAPISKPKK